MSNENECGAKVALNDLLGVLSNAQAALENAREWKLANDLIDASVEAVSMSDEIERLRKALKDAATSLNTLATGSGKDEFLDDWQQVRGYAANRSAEAMKALTPNAALSGSRPTE